MHTITTINELDALKIDCENYQATILLQGAQLVSFSTNTHPDNWLFVSEDNEYVKGKPIRGGIPICWPVFGAFDKNPQSVQSCFGEPLGQHGYARCEIWSFDSVEEVASKTIVSFSLPTDRTPKLSARIVFTFSENGYSIELTTTNESEKPLTFSQALHTYFPTPDISKTTVSGFENTDYVDTLTPDWAIKTQNGAITFEAETDRIYKAGSNCTIQTPDTRFNIKANNSNSTVIWNPWIEKSKTLSQFKDNDYLKMLCVETANAFDDVISLSPNEQHTLSLTCERN